MVSVEVTEDWFRKLPVRMPPRLKFTRTSVALLSGASVIVPLMLADAVLVSTPGVLNVNAWGARPMVVVE